MIDWVFVVGGGVVGFVVVCCLVFGGCDVIVFELSDWFGG